MFSSMTLAGKWFCVGFVLFVVTHSVSKCVALFLVVGVMGDKLPVVLPTGRPFHFLKWSVHMVECMN